MNEDVQDVDRYCREVKQGVGETATKLLEEVGKDREMWLARFEEVQRNHYDKKTELIQSDYQSKMDEKDTQLDSMRGKVEQLLGQFREAAAERDRLNQQLTGFFILSVCFLTMLVL